MSNLLEQIRECKKELDEFNDKVSSISDLKRSKADELGELAAQYLSSSYDQFKDTTWVITIKIGTKIRISLNSTDQKLIDPDHEIMRLVEFNYVNLNGVKLFVSDGGVSLTSEDINSMINFIETYDLKISNIAPLLKEYADKLNCLLAIKNITEK